MVCARKAVLFGSAVTLHALLAIALYALYFAEVGSLKYKRRCSEYQEPYGADTAYDDKSYRLLTIWPDSLMDFDLGFCVNGVEGILIISISSVPDFITYVAGVASLLVPHSQVRSVFVGGVCFLQLQSACAQAAVTAGTAPWIAAQVFPVGILLGGDAPTGNVPALVAALTVQSLVRIALVVCLLLWAARREPATAVVGWALPSGHAPPGGGDGVVEGVSGPARRTGTPSKPETEGRGGAGKEEPLIF
jgi:hypothetical protein